MLLTRWTFLIVCSHSGHVLVTAEDATAILGMDFLTPLGYVSLESNTICLSVHQRLSFDGGAMVPEVKVRKSATCKFRPSWEEKTNYLERVHIDVGHWKDFRLLVFVDS